MREQWIRSTRVAPLFHPRVTVAMEVTRDCPRPSSCRSRPGWRVHNIPVQPALTAPSASLRCQPFNSRGFTRSAPQEQGLPCTCRGRNRLSLERHPTGGWMLQSDKDGSVPATKPSHPHPNALCTGRKPHRSSCQGLALLRRKGFTAGGGSRNQLEEHVARK